MEVSCLNGRFIIMKMILMSVFLVCALFAGACSRSDEPTSVAKPTPDLKSDAERLQQATARAAEERRKSAPPPESPTPAAP